MTTKDFGRERPRRFSIGSRWGELGEHELLLRPPCVKPRCPGGLAVFHILVLMIKDHLEDRLEPVRHDEFLLEILRILEHGEMGKVYGPLANHHHVVSCDVGIRRVLLCGGTPSPKET